MDRPSIIAKSINNLTDARYFAAMGVDFIGFDLSPSNPDRISLEIFGRLKEWLEGPGIIGCFSGDESEEILTKHIVDGSLGGLYFERFPGHDLLQGLNSLELFCEFNSANLIELQSHPKLNVVLDIDHYKNVIKEEQLAELRDLNSQGRLYFSGALDESFFESEIFQNGAGIVLMGGEEEKVGFKSFDELDSIFELLQ